MKISWTYKYLFVLSFLGITDITSVTSIKQSACRNNHCQLSTFQYQECTIIVCYKDPRFNPSEFLRELGTVIDSVDQTRIIVVGDFNINTLPHPYQRSHLDVFFHKYGMRKLLDPMASTTDLGTQIDHCYSNIPNITASVSETYYSYHKAICVDWE